MTSVVIVCQIPGASVEVASALCVHNPWPEAEITFLHTTRGATQQFQYPRGLSLDQYPLVMEPVTRPRRQWTAIDRISAIEIEVHTVPMKFVNGRAIMSPPATKPHVDPFDEIGGWSIEKLRQADCIVFGHYSEDYRECVLFYRMVKEALGDKMPAKFPMIRIIDSDGHAIRSIMQHVPTTFFDTTCDPHLSFGLAKDYFDFNFNMNATAVLGELISRLCPCGARLPSKYAIQFLYAIRRMRADRNRSVMEEDVIQALSVGTGKHTPGSFHDHHAQARSPLAALHHLAKAGLIQRPGTSQQEMQRSKFRPVQLTGTGEEFLMSLHPDCEDPDLMCRIDQWCQAGIESSRPMMDQYIRTFFGKQKRFNPK